MKKNHLLILIMFSIVVGFVVGIGLKSVKWTDQDSKLWFILPGKLFIRSLEFFTIPIVFLGIVTATSSMNAKSNIRITLIAIGLCLVKHVIATLIGLVGSLIMVSLNSSFRSIPNSNHTQINSTISIPITKQKTIYDIVADILRNLIPRNIIRAGISQELTVYVAKETANGSVEFERKVNFVDGANVLGIMVFGTIFRLLKRFIYKDSN